MRKQHKQSEMVSIDGARLKEDLVGGEISMSRMSRLAGRTSGYVSASISENRIGLRELKIVCKECGLGYKDYIKGNGELIENATINGRFTKDDFFEAGMARWDDEYEVERCFDYYERKDWRNGKGKKIYKPDQCFYAFEHNNEELYNKAIENSVQNNTSIYAYLKQIANDIQELREVNAEIYAALRALCEKNIEEPLARETGGAERKEKEVY